jgi:hypothetical protein
LFSTGFGLWLLTLASVLWHTRVQMNDALHNVLSKAGRKGGKAKSPAKKRTARVNGKLGGRPPKKRK